MWISIWSSDVKNIYIWNTEIKEVYQWSTKIWPSYPTESIIYKCVADEEWRVFIPTAWCSSEWEDVWVPYDWNVEIDWDTYHMEWTSNPSECYSYWRYYTSWETYTVKITPVTKSYWRARWYSWNWTLWKDTLIEVLHDSDYKWYAISATNTWNYFRYCTYNGCSNLTNAIDENIPNTVTTIWISFRAWEYTGCSSLQSAANESFPRSITTIWDYFRHVQYRECTSLTSAAIEKFNNNVSFSVNNHNYRREQYFGCSSLTYARIYASCATPPAPSWYQSMYREWQFAHHWNNFILEIYWQNLVEWISTVHTTGGWTRFLDNSKVSQIKVPTSLVNSYKSSSYRDDITNSKFIWY